MGWRHLRERTHTLIDVKRDRRASMPEPAGELGSDNTLLMPEGGAPVPEQVRMDGAHTTHSVTESGALNPAERQQIGNDIRLNWYPPATTRLGHFRPNPHPQASNVEVSWLNRYSLADPHARVFHYDAGVTVTRVEQGQHGHEFVCVGGLWYHARSLREPDGSMAGWILWERIEDHAGLGDEPRDRARPESLDHHFADPGDNVRGH